jgi:4-amino-4-deoxy-L-arabinose transferase-like glycosyltransferase
MAAPVDSRPDRGASREPARAILLLVCLSLLLNLMRLGASPLWDQDETKYAQVAREVLWTGDWMTLHWNGSPWFVHPPLYFWLVAATGWLFGLGEFTARVWSALFGTGSVVLTYFLGRAWFSHRAGLLAGLVLCTTLQWFAQARLAVFDTVLVFWMLASVVGFWAGLQGSRAGYLAAFACAGLGTLTKGPVAALVPGLVALAYLAWRRELGRLREVPWLWGLALYAALGLSWYAVGYLRHSSPFLASVLGYYTVHRFVGVVENQSGPWWYYVPVLLLGGVPWNAFWPLAAVWLVRRAQPAFPLVWCGFVFAFFTAAQTKLPNYVLGFYPMAAVATGALLDSHLDRPHALRWGFWGAAALWLVFCGAVAAYGLLWYPRQTRELLGPLVVALGVFGVGVGGGAWWAFRGDARAALGALCAATAALFAVLVAWVSPQLDRYRPLREVGAAAASWARPGDVRVGYRIPNGVVFYSGLTWRAYLDVEPVRQELCRAGPARALVVAPTSERAALSSLGFALRLLQEVGGYAVWEKPRGWRVSCPASR